MLNNVNLTEEQKNLVEEIMERESPQRKVDEIKEKVMREMKQNENMQEKMDKFQDVLTRG